MIKLGSPVTDRATGQQGVLTLLQFEENHSRYYYFQPKALSPKDGLPVSGRWVVDSSVVGGIEVEDPKIPEGIMGSFATDTASGLSGTIKSLRVHVNGCFHVSLQSNQILPETGTVPDLYDVDIRRLEGEKIPKFTNEALEVNRKKNPSPENSSARLSGIARSEQRRI